MKMDMVMVMIMMVMMRMMATTLHDDDDDDHDGDGDDDDVDGCCNFCALSLLLEQSLEGLHIRLRHMCRDEHEPLAPAIPLRLQDDST